MDRKDPEQVSPSERLNSAIELAGIAGRPTFALTAKPSPEARFTSLFGAKDAALVRIFNDPPVLRRAGFSLEHDGNSRIIAGELRRVLVPGWKILELWRDGLLVYAIDGFVQPLWGSPRPDGSLQLNPLALAEPVYLFAELSRLVYEQSEQKPKRVEYRIFLSGLVEGANRASLSPGPLQRIFFSNGNRHYAPSSIMDRSVFWSGSNIDAPSVAALLVAEVYYWFGISDDGIPYVRVRADGTKVTDPEALKAAGAN